MIRKSLTGALIAGATLGVLAAGSAMAADIAIKTPIMKAPPPPFSWTGCYIGGGIGYGMWNQDFFLETDPGHVATTGSATAGGRGWFGTVGVGCDYQISSSIVIGAFGDWDFGNIKGQVSPVGSALVGTESEKWAWGAGGRIGWVVAPTVLTYFSGGYTQAKFDPISLAVANVAAHTYNGWFLGSGIDYAISFLPSGFFLRSEYRYSTYQADDLSVLTLAGGLTGAAINSKKYVQTVRSELTYRFNWH